MSGGNDGEVIVYAGSGLLALAAWCTQWTSTPHSSNSSRGCVVSVRLPKYTLRFSQASMSQLHLLTFSVRPEIQAMCLGPQPFDPPEV